MKVIKKTLIRTKTLKTFVNFPKFQKIPVFFLLETKIESYIRFILLLGIVSAFYGGDEFANEIDERSVSLNHKLFFLF